MLTDKYGMSFYKYCAPRFTTTLDPYKYIAKNNPLSGHHWTERKLKPNADWINLKIEQQHKTWLTYPEVINFYHPLNAMPRTPKETRMIQAQIDGNNNWWNIK